MGRVIVILLAGLFAARMLPAQPTSAPPSVARIAPSLPTLPPPLPSQTPVDYFRQILDMTPEERDKSLASRSESSRLFLQGKLKEFQALAPAVREARLQTLQLRWLVLPLMKAPADQRPARRPADRPGLDRRAPGGSQVVDGPGPSAYAEFMAIDWRKHISSDPGMHQGRPTIRGMRVTVYDILEYLASGMTAEEIVADFPYLTKDDILACLQFAANRERTTVAVQP